MPHLAKEFNRFVEEAPIDRLHLLEDRILCRVIKKPRRAGRFIISGQWEYATKTNIGRILKLGRAYTGPLQINDYVIFDEWGGRELQSPDETLILLRPFNVHAKIEQ